MADVTMCTNVLCKSKDYCYRFTAKASEFCQSYTNFLCEDDEDNCSYFYPNSKDSTNCKQGGVKRDGEICNLKDCTYPKCVQDDYCKYCHQTNGNHKMSCSVVKIQITKGLKE